MYNNLGKSEEQINRMKTENNFYVEGIRKAIIEDKVDEYFKSFGFKPRFVEIVELLYLYDDGEEIMYNLYDYIMDNIKNTHICKLVEKLEHCKLCQELIIRDFNKIYERILDCGDVHKNKIIFFIKSILNIPNTDSLVLSKLDDILDSINEGLVFLVIQQFENKPYFNNLFIKYFEKLINIGRRESISKTIELSLKINKEYTVNYIKDNFNQLLENLGEGAIIDLLYALSNDITFNELIKSNMELIISKSNVNNIKILLYSLDTKMNLNLLEKNDVLKLLKDKLTEEKKDHLALAAIVKSGKSEYLKELIKEVMKQEKVSTFKSIGDSTWSNIVFKIGNKVLKIGWIRNKAHCDNHYRIINQDLYEIILDNNEEPLLYIEIQDYLSQKNITEEDIEELYKDLEKDGYIYIDPLGKSISNFGILKKKDIDTSKGVSKSYKKKPVVLIDRDFVWKKDDPNIEYYRSSY